MKRKSKVYSISNNEFIKLVKESYSYSDILRELGLGTVGGSSTDILKERIKELNIDTSHFSRNRSINRNKIIKPLEEIMVKNSSYKNLTSLKKRIIKEGILDYRCSICGNVGIWNDKDLVLVLDHINGDNTDHRKENFRFLCPNCNSQMDTFAGKNKKI